jgi:hypothetical protein
MITQASVKQENLLGFLHIVLGGVPHVSTTSLGLLEELETNKLPMQFVIY